MQTGFQHTKELMYRRSLNLQVRIGVWWLERFVGSSTHNRKSVPLNVRWNTCRKKVAVFFLIEVDSSCCKQNLLFVVFASNNIVWLEEVRVSYWKRSIIHSIFYLRMSNNEFWAIGYHGWRYQLKVSINNS